MKISNNLTELLQFNIEFQQHCEELSRDGIGTISAMCHQSIVRTFDQNPRFSSIYQEESDRFSKMAERIMPSSLVATYMKLIAASKPHTFSIKRKDIDAHFTDLKKITSSSQEPLNDETRSHSGSFRFKPIEMSAYLAQCAKNPSLQLACIYYATELAGFVDNIITSMRTPEHEDDLRAFGGQMNAKNLTSALPLAIHIALEREHGSGATVDKIDAKTIECALRFMDTNEHFEAKGIGIGKSGRIESLSIRCPMKRYVFDLLLKQDGFLPYLRSVQTMSQEDKNASEEQVTHQKNMLTVANSASEASREYQ